MPGFSFILEILLAVGSLNKGKPKLIVTAVQPVSLFQSLTENQAKSFLFLRYVTNPDFDPNNIRSVSSACEGLCRWVRAMEVYERVAKVGSLKPSKNVL